MSAAASVARTTAQVLLEVRVAKVEFLLRRDEKRFGTAKLTVVPVRSGRRKQPICWTLVPTLAVKTAADALAVVNAYCPRWRVE
ncbi:MAG: hypothetical protein FJ137_13815 [Deltaproteobacteria bacterium]|nr:hypothetical protein [Deltaproteobacteria bacterium]